MRHTADPDFWSRYHRLPPQVQRQADEKFELLKRNTRHPSLHLKKIRIDLWSVRVSASYRALATPYPDRLHWFWIGSHADYDQLL